MSDEELDQTLDPDDWNELRALGHRMVDDMFDYLSTVRDRRAWQPIPQSVRDSFDETLPLKPGNATAVYEQFLENILTYTNGNRHPRFWGWVQGNGTALGMLADMLASGMNPHMAGFDQSPVLVEHQVIRWLTELMGMPADSSGIIVGGGTMANLLGLTVARHAKAGFDIRELGLQSRDRLNQPLLTMYGSSETHGWAQKAAELLGLGNRAFRRVPIDSEFRIDMSELRKMVDDDLSSGCRPFCVIGNVGTVNTGAIDDLSALSGFCSERDIWFHIDGAFGALTRLAPSFAHLVEGVEKADSIAFDLHKWMYLPFEIACVLIRDKKVHRDTFSLTPSYLARTSRGVIAGGLPFAELGIELTRSFRALKAWMSIKTHGIQKYADLIEQNINQAQYFSRLVNAHPELELVAPAPLNVVCFRYAPNGSTSADLNAINEEILIRMQESGLAVPSGTTIGGKFALRIAVTNHRSKRSDFDLLRDAVLDIGAAVISDRH